MASDFTLVDPKGWEYDLHSVYSAYIGYFQLHNIPWYDRSWGHLFSSFEEFLTFSWPTITVTDAWTGKPHIVTRLTSVGAFLKMIKTRFGETLPQAPNILQVAPFESSSRHLRHISDYASYKRLYATLPAVVLSALKARVKAGEPKAIRELWEKRDRTFLAVDFEWSERNESSCLEWGYAAVRCGHLDALGHWPPDPSTNYRAGHVIVSEYVDKVVNKHFPTYPWHFGESQVVSKTRLPEIIQTIIRFASLSCRPFFASNPFTTPTNSSLASPDSETTPNTLVLVAHGISGDLARLDEMKIKLPHNLLIIDTASFERALHSTGALGPTIDPRTNQPRTHGSTLSLENVVRSLPDGGTLLQSVTMHNAGNDAYMALFVLQALLDRGTKAPVPKVQQQQQVKKGIGRGAGGRPSPPMPTPTSMPRPRPMSMSMVGGPMIMVDSSPGLSTPVSFQRSSYYDLAEEFGAMKVERGEREKTGERGERERERVGSRGRRVPGRAVGGVVGNGRG
ncbi:hypothetical protein C0995_012892 [Termitomyces sp. Mi166|nr:hypothetical protein C0995_012892 [Termitomyces sp. Mi166\